MLPVPTETMLCSCSAITHRKPIFTVNQKYNCGIFSQQSVFNILVAYSMYNTEVGYCQGMNNLAAILLMYLGEEEAAFWGLHSLITNRKYSMHGKCLYYIRTFLMNYLLKDSLWKAFQSFIDSRLISTRSCRSTCQNCTVIWYVFFIMKESIYLLNSGA